MDLQKKHKEELDRILEQVPDQYKSSFLEGYNYAKTKKPLQRQEPQNVQKIIRRSPKKQTQST